jgi:hypothetical protein
VLPLEPQFIVRVSRRKCKIQQEFSVPAVFILADNQSRQSVLQAKDPDTGPEQTDAEVFKKIVEPQAPGLAYKTIERASPRKTILSSAVDNPALAQVVRREFNGHYIAGNNAYEVFSHSPSDMANNVVPTGQFNSKLSVGQCFLHLSFDLDGFFFSHSQCLKRASTVECGEGDCCLVASAAIRTTSAPTVAAASTAVATASATAAASFFARPRLVHGQWAPAIIRPVKGVDCLLGFPIVLHFYKTEPAGSASFPISNHLSPSHTAVLLKKSQQVVGCAFPCKVADVDILRHLKALPHQARRSEPRSAAKGPGTRPGFSSRTSDVVASLASTKKTKPQEQADGSTRSTAQALHRRAPDSFGDRYPSLETVAAVSLPVFVLLQITLLSRALRRASWFVVASRGAGWPMVRVRLPTFLCVFSEEADHAQE